MLTGMPRLLTKQTKLAEKLKYNNLVTTKSTVAARCTGKGMAYQQQMSFTTLSGKTSRANCNYCFRQLLYADLLPMLASIA
jgi:hypothetical protein